MDLEDNAVGIPEQEQLPIGKSYMPLRRPIPPTYYHVRKKKHSRQSSITRSSSEQKEQTEQTEQTEQSEYTSIESRTPEEIEKDELLCIVCMERDKTVLLECGHCSFCTKCIVKYRDYKTFYEQMEACCPLCDRKIEIFGIINGTI
jgi:uncharacterized ferredoxin-like protein